MRTILGQGTFWKDAQDVQSLRQLNHCHKIFKGIWLLMTLVRTRPWTCSFLFELRCRHPPFVVVSRHSQFASGNISMRTSCYRHQHVRSNVSIIRARVVSGVHCSRSRQSTKAMSGGGDGGNVQCLLGVVVATGVHLRCWT
jgi:hypothetical protein